MSVLDGICSFQYTCSVSQAKPQVAVESTPLLSSPPSSAPTVLTSSGPVLASVATDRLVDAYLDQLSSEAQSRGVPLPPSLRQDSVVTLQSAQPITAPTTTVNPSMSVLTSISAFSICVYGCTAPALPYVAEAHLQSRSKSSADVVLDYSAEQEDKYARRPVGPWLARVVGYALP